MIVKAEIQSIDYLKNTCTVRMPLFETAGSNIPTIVGALFSVTPGINGSYKVGDVVFVAFEENRISKPVVIGKLFLGNSVETLRSSGTIKCTDLQISNDAVLPITTKLTNNINNAATNISLKDNYAEYTSIKVLIDKVRELRCEKAATPRTIIIGLDVVKNIYGYTKDGFTAAAYGEDFIIKYNDKDSLTKADVLNYMGYMTGDEILPAGQYDETHFNTTFIKGGTMTEMFCPIWAANLSGEGKLILKKI